MTTVIDSILKALNYSKNTGKARRVQRIKMTHKRTIHGSDGNRIVVYQDATRSERMFCTYTKDQLRAVQVYSHYTLVYNWTLIDGRFVESLSPKIRAHNLNGICNKSNVWIVSD